MQVSFFIFTFTSHNKHIAVMKTTYYIIEKYEKLAMSSNPSDTKVYILDNQNRVRGGLVRRNKKEAIYVAKQCGMDVVIYIGNEIENDRRVFIS